MKRYLFIKFALIVTPFLLLFIDGCALQPEESKAPARLKDEVRFIEGQKTGSLSQPAIQGEKTTYIVKKGDTLWRISKYYGVSVDTILKVNHIADAKDLEVGQKLIIPASGRSRTSFTSSSNSKPTGNVAGGVSSHGFIWPVKGQIVSHYGETRNGVKNLGIYILPQQGQMVVAAKKGTVEAVTETDDGMHVIVIKHERGIRTIYRCRSNPVVGEGSFVEQGQPITSVNLTDTGKSQEVTFKIYVKDKPANPMSYLP